MLDLGVRTARDAGLRSNEALGPSKADAEFSEEAADGEIVHGVMVRKPAYSRIT